MEKVKQLPHVKREVVPPKAASTNRGKLKNGNPPGDPSKAPRCFAHARTTGKPCKSPAMSNGRCRLHGGKSTGPKTHRGLARSRRANWKTGTYSAEARRERKRVRELIAEAKCTIRSIKEKI